MMADREATASDIASSNDVSTRNKVRVVRSLMGSGPASRVSIARSTNMSPATVNRLTSALMKSGMVRQAGSDEATGGRPSMLVEFSSDRWNLLSVDLCSSSLEVALLDLSGQIVERQTVSAKNTSPEQKLNLLVETVSSWAHREGTNLAAIGISAPGPVSADGTVLLAPALDWYNVPALAALREVTSIPVSIENDVNLIALAEYKHLDSPSHRTLVALAVFQGVGAGIVEDGRLWRGNHGAAGQFGRMLRDVSGLRHQRLGFGHLESRLGSAGILQRAINAGVLDPETASVDELFAAAQAGSPPALEMVESISDEYAFHLVNVCAIIAPDIIVFGGLFERWSRLLLPLIRERLEGNVIHLPDLRTAELGDAGKLVGAGLYALDNAGGLAALVQS